MTETEKVIVGTLISTVLLLAPGYLLHVAPRFPGSLAGGMIGIGGAVLILGVLLYPLAKYVGPVNRIVTRFISMRAILSFHIYAGVMGPLFGILHSGHKYQSPIGITIVVLLLSVVITGFIGRYYLAYVSMDLREKQEMLTTLRGIYDTASAARATAQQQSDSMPSLNLASDVRSDLSISTLTGSIADLEYSISANMALKKTFLRWIDLHTLIAIALYLLLVVHVLGEIYYGLRWL